MTDYAYSRKVAHQSGSNFYWSFFFLPKKKRNGILTIYAFSRLVDDAVDEARDPEKARSQIGLWRRRLQFCFNGHAGREVEPTLAHPLLPELSDTIRRFQIPDRYFLDLLTGVEMDFSKKRYETFAELETYCYHVAGTIGLLCNHLFGLKEDRGRPYAILLGCAFQLTNILRDLGADARRGRLYLPLEDLRRFDLSERDLLEGKGGNPDSFQKLMQFEAERAERYFQKAFETLSLRERKAILPAEIMAAIYYRLLKKIRQRDFPVYEETVSLTFPEKAGLVLKTLLKKIWSGA